jgi:hypothetical protein
MLCGSRWPACQNSPPNTGGLPAYPGYRTKHERTAGMSAVPLMADASGPVTDTVNNVPLNETALAVACGNASAALRQGAGPVNGM